jgi:2-polyprenyl-3-methyl-5-hydroxy-6-metoxy-1,4-benzoquinol methylase
MIEPCVYFGRKELLEMERRIRIERHVERYALLRQFAKGVVCDAACGCGYGSYLLASNPDVEWVIGVDRDGDAIAYARKEYGTEKTEFCAGDLVEWTCGRPIDMLISVETIEHLEDKTTLPSFVERNGIKHVVLTYPSKKTSHYNPFHHHDFRLSDILEIFGGYTCYRHFNWEYEFDVVFLLKNPV